MHGFRTAIKGLLLASAVLGNAALADVTIEPLTWNFIGLDSNNVNAGPNRFPVGARVCSPSGTGANDVLVDFTFTTANANINLRIGSLSTIDLGSFTAGQCKDAYFDVAVTRTVAAYDTTRGYTITASELNTANSATTPSPRELYVERLISQSRNSITGVAFGPVGGPLTSVGPGGALNLVIGNTYDILITGQTATQGYEQFAAFAGLTNSLYRIVAVSTTLSAVSAPNSGGVVSPNDRLYADACLWEDDPNGPNYGACLGSGKAGGTFSTLYTVEVISVAAGADALFSLIYDYSGSSYHYNSDYDAGGRIVNIIDPNAAGFSKLFIPSTIPTNGVSTLRFTISNPNAVSISGYNFVDNLPAGLVVANPPNASTSGCGAASFSPTAGATSISFNGGTLVANGSCSASVQVTGASVGSYNNVSNNLFIGTTDTGQNATATLTISDNPHRLQVLAHLVKPTRC
ncbi:MAG: hypothetical protein KDI51_05225 [Xanthomonadales bacterium]|nr:hypothetical protein [Xanthomonadales bacterium]MCB1633969.1 hypothetical protein [Xanthomonadales bacterium]